MPYSDLQLKAISDGLDAGKKLADIVIPPRSSIRKRNNEEWELQSSVFRWWRAHASDYGIDPRLYFSIPNGAVLGFGKERIIRGKMLKLAGAENGAPDTFLAVPRDKYCGLFIEYKATNGVLSDAQKEIQPCLVRQHYQVRNVYSLVDAKEVIEGYLNL